MELVMIVKRAAVASIVLLVLSFGLGTLLADTVAFLQAPGQSARAMAAMFGVVPGWCWACRCGCRWCLPQCSRCVRWPCRRCGPSFRARACWGAEAGNRAALATAASLRHPGVALAMATTSALPDSRQVTATILIYLLIATLLGIGYGRLRKGRQQPG